MRASMAAPVATAMATLPAAMAVTAMPTPAAATTTDLEIFFRLQFTHAHPSQELDDECSSIAYATTAIYTYLYASQRE